VTGKVVTDANCPATAATSCPLEPLAGVPLTIVRVSDSLVVAQPTTASDGTFSTQLGAGQYQIHGAGLYSLISPAPMTFDVSAGSTTTLVLRYEPANR